MFLPVPLYRQSSPLDCGPTNVRMVTAFLEKDVGIERIRELIDLKDGQGVSTIKLAIAAAKLGFSTSFYSTSLFFDTTHGDLDFYKEHGDLNLEASKKLVREAEENKVDLHEQSLSLEDLLSFVNNKSIPIVLLDWSVIDERVKGYMGHFVPIVGYDEEMVYVHNIGVDYGRENMPIKRETFERARKAKGTDEDILVISKK